MRSRPGDLRYDRRSRRFQGRLEATLLPARPRPRHPGPRRRAGRGRRAGRPIARGETIARRRRRAWLPVASLPDDGLRRAEDLVGRQAVRPLAAGRAARAGEVAAPGRCGVARRSHGVQPRAAADRHAAEVLENGRQGQSIRVRNAASGEVRQAVVVGPRRVEVLRHRPMSADGSCAAARAGGPARSQAARSRSGWRHRPPADTVADRESGAGARLPAGLPADARPEPVQSAGPTRSGVPAPRAFSATSAPGGSATSSPSRSACRTTPAGPTRPRARARPITWASPISSVCRTSR